MHDRAENSRRRNAGAFQSRLDPLSRGRAARFKRWLPDWAKRPISRSYWLAYDTRDFCAEAVGRVPSHGLRLWWYRHLLGVSIGPRTSIHRGCRVYRPSGVTIGAHTIINRDVLLDGRMGLSIGDNVSISEGVAIFTLEHDPDSRSFARRGGAVQIGERAFIGARAMVLPGVSVGEGAVVGAGAVVTRAVAPYTIVAGVPARLIGERTRDLSYKLDYRKFLG